MSVIFHPLLMVTCLFSIFALWFPLGLDPLKEENHWGFIGLIFGITFVLPALNISMFKAFGMIQTLSMEERRERVLPFSFVTILYVVVTYLFFIKTRVSFHDNLLKFLLVADVLILLSTIVTLFYKVSIHSLAAWGMIGILLPLNKVSEDGALFYPTIGAILAAGIVMSSRLQLNAHTPREVLVGALIGFAASFMSMLILF